MCVCIYVCIYVVYVRVCVCACVHARVYIYVCVCVCRGTDFPRSRNRGKAYLKRNSRFSAKILLITSKKHTLLTY